MPKKRLVCIITSFTGFNSLVLLLCALNGFQREFYPFAHIIITEFRKSNCIMRKNHTFKIEILSILFLVSSKSVEYQTINHWEMVVAASDTCEF